MRKGNKEILVLERTRERSTRKTEREIKGSVCICMRVCLRETEIISKEEKERHRERTYVEQSVFVCERDVNRRPENNKKGSERVNESV
jgi:hypothetical protein